jgi:hypothetical protein
MLDRLTDSHWFWVLWDAGGAIWFAHKGNIWLVAMLAACGGMQLAWALNGGVILSPDEGRT